MKSYLCQRLSLSLLTLLATSAAHAQFNPFGGGFGGGAGGGTTRSSTTGTGQPLGGADISFDPETRNLIVVTDDKTLLEIKKVVTGLDRPSPQVLIKVIFLEAIYNKNSDIGFSGGYSHNPNPGGSSGIVGQGFGLPTVTSIGAAVASGGGIYSILGNDFQATLTAIAKAGKTEILKCIT